jgi:arginine-tRNA-protein transferase
MQGAAPLTRICRIWHPSAMHIIQPPQMEEISDCPYLPGRRKRYESFLADRLDAGELARLLAEGWRKFGLYYFRPACPECRLCIPLRVPVADFSPSRSQRRLLRRNAGLRIASGRLKPSQRIYEIYREHSRRRFDQESDPEEFLFSFYLQSCPGLQLEIRRGEEMIAFGLLDQGSDCLSSVYFAFDPRHAECGLGNFGALQEIELARSFGLAWYYLGYYVPGSPRMAYKDHFRPREYWDWEGRRWRRAEGPPEEAAENPDVTGRPRPIPARLRRPD